VQRAQEYVTDDRQIWVGAQQDSPGLIRHTASEHTDIGLYPNSEVDDALENARLEGFAAMLRAAETSYKISDDIQVKRWEKVVWNVSASEYPSGRQNTDFVDCMESSYHIDTTKHTRMALIFEGKRVNYKAPDARSDKRGEKSWGEAGIWACRCFDGEDPRHAGDRE